MKNVQELLERFSIMQNFWNTKLPIVSTTEEIRSCIMQEILSGKKDKDDLSPYVVLLVVSLKKFKNERLENLQFSAIKDISEDIKVNSTYEDMYILLLAVEGYLN